MISLDDLKAYLEIGEADESKDAILTALEAAAVAYVSTQTGRYFGADEETVIVLQGTGTPRLWLPESPTDVDAVEVVQFAYVGGDGTAIDAADDNGFVVRGTMLVRKRGLKWDHCYEYQVTFSRGYDEDGEPEDIRQLVRDMVSAKYGQLGKEGFKAETYGGYSYSYGDGDLGTIAGARETIAAYRRVRV